MRTVRRFSDEVHVRSGVLGEDDDAPVQFVWRNRLYVVREVLTRWRERSAWWEQPVVAAVHGDDRPDEQSHSGAGGSGTATAVRRVLELGDLEREVWRVEAGIGRGRVLGVYDLARRVDPGTAAVSEVAGTPSDRSNRTGTTAEEPVWQLLRVSD